MADHDYQPRTPERLVEVLRAQSQNPRSWSNEAADAIERFMSGDVTLAWMAWNQERGFDVHATWKREPSDVVKKMHASGGWEILPIQIRRVRTQ